MAQRRKGEQLPPGYLMISRKIYEHPFWMERRVFSRHEAWEDLIQSAWFGEKPSERIISGSLIRHYRGELVASERYLETRWRWPKTNVRRFLQLLEAEKMITRRTDNNQTIITLVNYVTYNTAASNAAGTGASENPGKSGPQSGPPNGPHKPNDNKDVPTESGPQSGPPNGPPADHPRTKEEEYKESIGDIGSGETPPPPDPGEERFKAFIAWIDKNAATVNQLAEPFTREEYDRIREKYTKEMVQEVILAMHNTKDLLKKYRSANLTCLNWCKRRKNDSQGTTTTPSAAQLILEAKKKQTA